MSLSRVIVGSFLVILSLVLYRLWFDADGIPMWFHLSQQIREKELENKKITEKNAKLMAELQYLKAHPEAIEELARSELGMLGQQEQYYQVVILEEAS